MTEPTPTNTGERLSTYLARIEEVMPQMEEQSIVLSTDYEMAPLAGEEVRKVPIAWPLYTHNMFYLVTAEPGTRIARHSHQEDIFRYVARGSLVVNDIEISEGMWFVVRKNTPYEIHTDSGYTCFSGYKFICKPMAVS